MELVFSFQGSQTSLEDIMYKPLRCQLLHEGEMPTSIVFTKPKVEVDQVVHSLHLTTPLDSGRMGRAFGKGDMVGTGDDDLWQDEYRRRERVRKQFGEQRHDGLYCRRPGGTKTRDPD